MQISPVLYSRNGTTEKIVEEIRDLGKQGVQFAAVPETIVPYYPYFSLIQARAEYRWIRAAELRDYPMIISRKGSAVQRCEVEVDDLLQRVSAKPTSNSHGAGVPRDDPWTNLAAPGADEGARKNSVTAPFKSAHPIQGVRHRPT